MIYVRKWDRRVMSVAHGIQKILNLILQGGVIEFFLLPAWELQRDFLERGLKILGNTWEAVLVPVCRVFKYMTLPV